MMVDVESFYVVIAINLSSYFCYRSLFIGVGVTSSQHNKLGLFTGTIWW